MAKETGPKNGTQEHETSKGWVRIQTDRPVYSADRGSGAVVAGIVLGLLDMPPVMGKPWKAFVVRLTVDPEAPNAKVAVPVTRNKQKTTATTGDEILVPANHKLTQALARAAVHPRVAYEVRIAPKGSTPTASGAVINFDIDVNPQPVARSAADRMVAMQSSVPQLPEASIASADADIPF